MITSNKFISFLLSLSPAAVSVAPPTQRCEQRNVKNTILVELAFINYVLVFHFAQCFTVFFFFSSLFLILYRLVKQLASFSFRWKTIFSIIAFSLCCSAHFFHSSRLPDVCVCVCVSTPWHFYFSFRNEYKYSRFIFHSNSLFVFLFRSFLFTTHTRLNIFIQK